MSLFPERLMVGGVQQSVTYTLAKGHYLIRIHDTENFSALERFAAGGLMPGKIPDYIEAARETLEPAGFRWIEVASVFSAEVAEAQLAADAEVEEVLPVYFTQGGGVESAATPLHDTINVELGDDANGVISAVEALGLSHNANVSTLLAPVHMFHVNAGKTRAEATDLLTQIAALPSVLSAEFDWLKLETYTAAPNDTNFLQQWGLNAIELAGALDLATGSPNVWIGVIDSGFDLNHPDINFTPNTAANPTHFNAQAAKEGKSPPYDASSAGVFHGTAVAGIAAARINNALGVAGVGGGCQVMPVRLGTPSAANVAAGVNWAANNGARVASMSLTTTGTVCAHIAMANAWGAGLVLCAATGNKGDNTTSPAVGFPASHPYVIAVGASDQSAERKRPVSADGETKWGSQFDNNIDVVAPGVRIWTTGEQGTSGYNNNGGPVDRAGAEYPSSGDGAGDYFSVFNGTSAATPHVAGLAGLLFSAAPAQTNAQVRNLIESTCEKISLGLYPYTTVVGRPNGTWHQEVGYGQINARAALQALLGVLERES